MKWAAAPWDFYSSSEFLNTKYMWAKDSLMSVGVITSLFYARIHILQWVMTVLYPKRKKYICQPKYYIQKKNYSLNTSLFLPNVSGIYFSLSLFPQILPRSLFSNLHICLKNPILNLVIAPICTVICFKIALWSNPTETSKCRSSQSNSFIKIKLTVVLSLCAKYLQTLGRIVFR